MRNDLLARRRFRALVRQPEPLLDLAAAALCIAWEDQGEGRPETALHELDRLAAEAGSRIERLASPRTIVAALNHYLFDELDFHGNTWSYSEPRNSFLDCVLAERVGLPITLSVVYLEVGWRLGLPVAGVALPGHFLARYIGPGEEIFVDPFNRGRLWSRAECELQVAAAYGSAPPALMQQVMAPPSKRAILARILRNLKQSYIGAEDFPRALAAVERIILLDSYDPQEIRDRGLLRARLGQVPGALEDLDRYAHLAPHAPDLPELRRRARALAAHIAAGN
jgi:regulator of sirC expression with transglutaminase-like and TPR domain